MKEKILEYLRIEKDKLDSGEVEYLNLKGVYASAIEEVFGESESDDVDFNGWQGDYWYKTDRYEISGCMYYGTATIELRNEEEEEC